MRPHCLKASGGGSEGEGAGACPRGCRSTRRSNSLSRSLPHRVSRGTTRTGRLIRSFGAFGRAFFQLRTRISGRSRLARQHGARGVRRERRSGAGRRRPTSSSNRVLPRRPRGRAGCSSRTEGEAPSHPGSRTIPREDPRPQRRPPCKSGPRWWMEPPVERGEACRSACRRSPCRPGQCVPPIGGGGRGRRLGEPLAWLKYRTLASVVSIASLFKKRRRRLALWGPTLGALSPAARVRTL